MDSNDKKPANPFLRADGSIDWNYRRPKVVILQDWGKDEARVRQVLAETADWRRFTGHAMGPTPLPCEVYMTKEQSRAVRLISHLQSVGATATLVWNKGGYTAAMTKKEPEETGVWVETIVAPVQVTETLAIALHKAVDRIVAEALVKLNALMKSKAVR